MKADLYLAFVVFLCTWPLNTVYFCWCKHFDMQLDLFSDAGSQMLCVTVLHSLPKILQVVIEQQSKTTAEHCNGRQAMCDDIIPL